MKEKYIQILGLVFAFVYAIFIVFLYAAEPRNLEEMSSRARSTISSAATQGEVLIGSYEVNQVEFDRGLGQFRSDDFVAARDSFQRADPAQRDAKTQFYIAYSYYRQGWGRFSSDDALLSEGLGVLSRVSRIDPGYRSDDPDLKLKTPSELRHELEQGLTVTADDFNPFKLARERK